MCVRSNPIPNDLQANAGSGQMCRERGHVGKKITIIVITLSTS